jgi:hypothetical protein
MGLMRWMRGGDENSATAAAVSAGLAEIDGLFRPSRHKQTEHVEESKRKRVDVANGAGIDLDRGIATLSVEVAARSAAGTDNGSADRAAGTDEDAADTAARPAARPRTMWVPRKQSWWSRVRRERRRRARARAAARG